MRTMSCAGASPRPPKLGVLIKGKPCTIPATNFGPARLRAARPAGGHVALRRVTKIGIFGRRAAATAALALSVVVVLGASAAEAQVAVTAEGTVPESCALTLPTPAQANLLDLASTAPRTINVTVNCNTPWTYSLVSTSGALTAQAPPTVRAGTFSTTLPYTVTASFGTETGSFSDVVRSSSILTGAFAAGCVANVVVGCPFPTSGSDISVNKAGTLILNWTTPANPLVAATYTDILTLTVLVL